MGQNELKPGDVFQVGLHTYKAIEYIAHHNLIRPCHKCDFYHLCNESRIVVDYLIGKCDSDKRNDGKAIYFEEIMNQQMNKREEFAEEAGKIIHDSVEFKTNMDEAVKDVLRKYIEVSLLGNTDACFEVFVTWKCKTLQNCKWLMCTNLPDNKYYELTYNGDKAELYIDAYQKEDNVVINMPHEA